MAYEFKKLSAVEAVETPADTANILIEENGVIKKTPSGVFTGCGLRQLTTVYITEDCRLFYCPAPHYQETPVSLLDVIKALFSGANIVFEADCFGGRLYPMKFDAEEEDDWLTLALIGFSHTEGETGMDLCGTVFVYLRSTFNGSLTWGYRTYDLSGTEQNAENFGG